MYPKKFENLSKINEELQRKIQTTMEEKARIEAAARKEKKLCEEKIASVEESAKVMEEMVQDAQYLKDATTTKLEEEQRKSSLLEEKISGLERELQEKSGQVLSLEKRQEEVSRIQSELTRKVEVVEADRDAKDLERRKLGGIILVLERQLKELNSKVSLKEETNDWKEKFLKSEEKLAMVLNKKKASQTQQICQLQDKVNAISSQAKEEIKEKVKENDSVKEALRMSSLKNQSLEDEKRTLLGSIQEKSNSIRKLEESLAGLEENQEKVKNEVLGLKSTVKQLETEKKFLQSSESRLIKSSETSEAKLYRMEERHFTEVKDLQLKYQHLERKQMDELARIEELHTSQLAGLSTDHEKTKIKLKVAEDINNKAANEVIEMQEKVKMFDNSNGLLMSKLADMKEQLQSEQQEKEQFVSRYEEAERRLNESFQASSLENFQRENFVSWKTRYEYQINFLTEQLRRAEVGVSVQTAEKRVDPPAPPVSDEEDENEKYLRYLDTDTTAIINNLKSQVQQLELKAASMETAASEKEIRYEEVLVRVEREKEIQQQLVAESAVSGLLNDLLSSVLISSTERDTKERMADLEHQLQKKEAEVLYVRSEAEELEEALRRAKEEREEKSQPDEDPSYNLSRSAFLQCGLIPVDKERELQLKVEELQKLLEEKEDHFFRELEVLKLKNSSLHEQTESLSKKSQNEKSLEAELEEVSTRYNQLLQDFKQKDIDVGVLNVSLDMEKQEIEESQREKDQLKQENSELLGKIEAMEASQANKLALSSKQRELEVATLKSELERTKDKLKQSQEANIRVHEDLFIEHKEILDVVRSMPARKRKRFFEEASEESKRRREENEEGNLLDDTLDGSLSDPKENIGLQINGVLDDQILPTRSDTEDVGDKAIKEEVNKPQVILASWDL